MQKNLSAEQISHYRTEGYLVLENFVSKPWLDRLNAVTQSFVDLSRKVSTSDKQFDVEPDQQSRNWTQIPNRQDVDPPDCLIDAIVVCQLNDLALHQIVYRRLKPCD